MNQLIKTFSVLAFTASIAAACQNSADESNLDSYIAQQSNDVQLLQMWTDKSISFSSTLCAGASPQDGQTLDKDCSEPAKDLVRPSWTNVDSPTATPWTLPFRKYQGLIYSSYGAGNLVEIRVLVKKAVIDSPVFTGIGFYYSNRIKAENHVIEKSALHVVNTKPVRLAATGEEAVVLRFVAYMPGYQGNSGTGWSMDSLILKPFAEFNDGTNTYQNWDNSSKNYEVYRSINGGGRHQITSIDRQAELIQN